MVKELVISGFGVIGTEVLYRIIKKNKNSKLKISIIDKDFSNFPGGVAYSKLNSKHGFFNNPLRLSNNEFQKWVKKKINQKKLIEYFKSTKDLNLSNWLNKNSLYKLNKFKKINELYLPRSAYAIFLEDKFIKTLNLLKSKDFIKIRFYENELVKVIKVNHKKKYFCHVNNNLKKCKLVISNKKLIIKNDVQKKQNIIKADNIILGLGILPPSNINLKKDFKNYNYIHDFYASGATSNLLKKISKKQNLNKISIVFIGNKAGLLETVQEIENLNKDILKKIKITSISSSSLSLQKAELSKNYKSYKFKYLVDKNISKIRKSDQILQLIKSEFTNGIKKKYNKYDVWTQILKKKLLDKCFKKLPLEEKKVYNNSTFSNLRNITRYTYPETVETKNRLEKKKILKNLKDKVLNLSNNKNKILVKTEKKNNLLADIVVNVSGPVSLMDNKNEVPCLNSLKKICKNFNKRGFISDKYNQIGDKIYAPGTLSSNFNPERKTIINSITQNCDTTATHLLRFLGEKKWN